VSATVFYASSSELATLTNTFSVNGVPTDPTGVTVTVTSPSGVATTYLVGQLTHTPASGVYSIDIPCTETGVWLYLWVGTGAASDAVAGTWTVHSTSLNRLYCTPAELKSRVGIDDNLDDDQILAACEAASRWIDGHCDRQFWRGSDTRTFAVRNAYVADIDDLVSLTAITTDTTADGSYATTLAASQYQLWPVNAASGPEPRPYTQVRAVSTGSFPGVSNRRYNVLQIAGVFGWPAVPDAVKHAAAIQAADYLKGGAVAFGQGGYGEYAPVMGRVNPVVAALLAPYRKFPVLVG